MIVIKKFHFVFLGIKKLPKDYFKKRRMEDKNATKYIKWVLKVLRKIKTCETYSAICISMNRKNIDKLHDRMHGMTWLNYAPKEDNSLKDNQYSIDLEKMCDNK
jgi:hypothetical protein